MAESKDFRHTPWLKRGTRLERILCFTTVLSLLMVAILTLVLAYYGYHYKINLDSKERLSNVCLTPGCIKAASSILSSLDENADPCKDFYRFACGEWQKTHTIPDDQSHVDEYTIAEQNLQLKLKNLLEAKLNGTEPVFIKMAKDLYDSCMDIKTIEKEEAKPLQTILENLGGWPVIEGRRWKERKFDWLETLISLRKLGLDHDTLIDLSVVADVKYNSRNVIHLGDPSLGMNDRSYYIRGLNDSVTAAYYEKMVKAATLLGADESVAEKELLEVLEFESILANYSVPEEEKRNISKFINKYTIKALQAMAPQIPWLKYINGLLAISEIYENETINVAVPDYMKKIAELITNTDKRVIANYILWSVVDSSLSLLSKEWRNLDLEYSKVLTGESKEQPRWEECLSNNALAIALSSYYVRHHFRDETKEEVAEIVKYVYKEFLSILDETYWMDQKTKSHAKAKANNMIFVIGYPDELLNDTLIMEHYQGLTITNDNYFKNSRMVYKWSVDYYYSKLRKPNKRNDWINNGEVAIVNAFYSPLDNSIALPAGYLQTPFFSSDLPNYLNFGALGHTIGHEITHGFDDEGRQFDKDGNNVNWWADIADERFRKEAQCVIDQYSNYTAENGMNLNGVSTQGENIADMGGIKESYWAYQSWVKDNGQEQLLPGLKYNQNQLFWISSAIYNFCSNYRPEFLRYAIISSRHSPDKFRVIGPLSNFVEFSKDFNCPSDSPMNRKHKCQVW